jgi:hypothetical protein
MNMLIKISLCITLLMAMAGCAAKGDYPSLAPRPFERATQTPTVAPPTRLPATTDAALVQRVGNLVEKARAGVGAFNTALSQARPIVAASDGVRASERWIAAQMALSRVERTREPIESALAEIDDERRHVVVTSNSADRDYLDAATREVEAINASQQAAIRGLLAQISRR